MKKRIIPCLDIQDGSVVKGKNFKDIKEIADPVELAVNYEQDGADVLFMLDIDGKDRGIFLDIVRLVRSITDLPLYVGGGIQSMEDIKATLENGADKVSITSAAINNRDFLRKARDRFGKNTIILSIDAKEVAANKWHAFTAGGKSDSGLDVLDWAAQGEADGVSEILLNSIDADGVKGGYDIALHQAVAETVDIPVIASGGAGRMEDFKEVFDETGVDAALAASVFHYDEISIEDLKAYLEKPNDNNTETVLIDKKAITFDENGLIPAIVQDETTGEVLTLAYMNETSLDKTIETKETWLYSRSRQELWHKGATSGNKQEVKSIQLDCDGDALLVTVVPHGPACHTGAVSCFTHTVMGKTEKQRQVIHTIIDTIEDRRVNPIDGAYTTYLFKEGIDKVLKKIGEESAEVIIGAKNNDKEEIKWEISDLVYHTLVLMNITDVELSDIKEVLYERHIAKKEADNE